MGSIFSDHRFSRLSRSMAGDSHSSQHCGPGGHSTLLTLNLNFPTIPCPVRVSAVADESDRHTTPEPDAPTEPPVIDAAGVPWGRARGLAGTGRGPSPL